jgi:protein-tyrosine-phosphatase
VTPHDSKQTAHSESASKPEPKKVLFVCMGNCVRSQMAEAIAKHIAKDVIVAESAGVSPLGFIDKTVCEVLAERSISYQGQYSKGLHSHKLGKPHLVVNMSGIPGRSLFHEHDFEDWAIRDPFGEDVSAHREVFEDIQRRIEDLAARLRSPDLESE